MSGVASPSARFDKRREEIVDRAATLFASKSYAATGITELCDAVGLGRGALYYYIESKESLLVAIQNRVLEPLLARACAVVGADAAPLVKMRLISEALVAVILSRADHIRVYENDYNHLTGDNLRQVLEQRRAFRDLVMDVFRAAEADGSLRAPEPELATLQFLNLHNHTYMWAATASHRWTATELSREYCRTLLHGMAAAGAPAEAALEGSVDLLRRELDGHATAP